VWIYYFLGHFTGPERAIRGSHLGLLDSMAWALHELFHPHLNGWFVSAVLVATGLLLIPWCQRARTEATFPWPTSLWLPAMLFFAAPFLILSVHDEKSFVTISALVPPLLLLVLEGWAFLLVRRPQRARFRLLPALSAAVVLGAGAAHFLSCQAAPSYDAGFATDARALNRFADRISILSRRAGLTEPKVAVDQVTDSLDGQVLRVMAYERQHVWQSFVLMLPTGIAAQDSRYLEDRMHQSDFVILHAEGSDGIYPFDHEMTRLLPETRAWCDRHLTVIERFTLFGRAWTLYARREIAAKAAGSPLADSS
jgi:hypothetical protein